MKQTQATRQGNDSQSKPTENSSGVPFPDEILHLAAVNGKLEDALEKAEVSVDRLDREYNEAKRYMAVNRGEIDPHEMFQNELALREIDSSGAFAVEIRDRIAKLKDSPYFARIDFREKAAESPVPYYIGRFAFSHEGEPIVFDWRAPLASVFYDSEPGPASYTAPCGRISGELTRKRQLKIQKGRLEYALETDVNIQDDVLQRELSHTSDDRMKSIIATIQKEQNQIIRNERAKTLIIQGVAGSGKTSIALHRIAYLLYRFKDKLTAQNITIISPNKVFGDYISNVLPELGEEPIFEVSLVDIAGIQLEGIIGFEVDRDSLETTDIAWAERARYKSTLGFLKQLDRYIETLPNRVFEAEDYTYGPFTATADWIRSRFQAYGKHPVKQRLQQVAEDILDTFETGNRMEDDLPKNRTILKALKAMLKTRNTLALYKDFHRQLGKPGLLMMPGKKTLEWNDVYPFLHLHAAFEGVQQSRVIRHLVIDEMQDYTPVQLAALEHLFPCQKTVLGDFNQRINPNHLHSLEDIRQLYGNALFMALNNSYRSTYEIIQFAGRIQRIEGLKAIERHGEKPAVLQCGSRSEMFARLRAAISAFGHNGYASLGIIAKTNEAAKALHRDLDPETEIQLITADSDGFSGGVSIVSVPMSKGLEFDEVIVVDASEENYHTVHDRRLLYVACTRAMHRLTLLSAGPCTGLLAQE